MNTTPHYPPSNNQPPTKPNNPTTERTKQLNIKTNTTQQPIHSTTNSMIYTDLHRPDAEAAEANNAKSSA